MTEKAKARLGQRRPRKRRRSQVTGRKRWMAGPMRMQRVKTSR